MIGNIFTGFSYLFQGFRIILQPGFRLFLIIPLLINIILFTALIIWAKSLVGGWMATLLVWVPDWLNFLEWFFWGIYFIIILMTLFYGFITIANLITAPFYGYLAELTERSLTGQPQENKLSWHDLIALIPRTVLREVQKIIYYLPRVMVLLVISVIPGINIVAPFLWLLFSSRMMAIQYVDYPADNHNMSFSTLKNYLSSHPSASFGFGLITFSFTLIPIINFIALPAAVCGGVVYWLNEKPDASELIKN